MSWLSGYTYRKPIAYTAGVGAGADYQVVVKCYYASGSDGTESLNGETVAKLYLAGKCQADFDDVRFALAGSSSAYVYKRTSKTDSNNAVFIFKVSDSMDAVREIYCYYGNASAVDASSDLALIDVIPNVVGAWALDEVVVGDAIDYSGNGNDGVSTVTSVVDGRLVGKKARNYDGVNDFITVADDAALNFSVADFSVCFWFKPGIVTWQNVLYKRNTGAGINPGYQFSTHLTRMYNFIGDGADAITPFYANDALQVDVWQNCIFNGDRDGDGIVYINNVAGTDSAAMAAIGNMDNALDLYIGGLSDKYTGVLADVLFFNSLLSLSQRTNLAASANYPDSKLVAGSVLVRKWATTTLPAVSSIGPEEPTYEAGTDIERGPPAPVPKMPHEFMRLLKAWLEAKTKVNS